MLKGLRNKFLRWRLARQTRKVARFMMKWDRGMLKAGYPRWKRKQFWREVVKDQEVRNTIREMPNVWLDTFK